MSTLGEPVNRVDGRLKVTGSAKYSAEFEIPHLAYAVMVQSTIASGRIVRMDTSAAEKIPGVIAVLKPGNALKLPGAERRVSVLQDDLVHYDNQPIAVVVAETLDQAHHAASAIRVEYAKTDAKLNFEAGFPTVIPAATPEFRVMSASAT